MSKRPEPCEQAVSVLVIGHTTCELIGDLQADNSVGQVIFIGKKWDVDFAVRYQALLCVMGKI